MKCPSLVPFFLVVMGCSASFDKSELRRTLSNEPLQVTDEEIQRVLDIKPQLRFPMKLGVYLAASEGPAAGESLFTEWSEAERTRLTSEIEALKAAGIISDVIVISDVALEGEDRRSYLKRVRLAAARYRADAVLLVRGAAATDNYSNPFSLLYLTIVGLFVAPGTNTDAIYLLSGSLWDVRNECLYMTIETEGTASSMRPIALNNASAVIGRARAAAIEKLEARCLAGLRSLKGAGAGPTL